MDTGYFTIEREGKGEFTLSRSRFICRSKPVSVESEALAYIDEIRKELWDATHNVWAYVLGDTRERYSDDGEPRGTAGIPVLDVIRKEGVRDAVVVITRYFGGIKLGAGGLVRAYTQGAKLALEAAGIVRRVPYLSFCVACGYTFAEKLKRELAARGYLLKDTEYLDNVRLSILIPQEEIGRLHALVAEHTAGQGIILAGAVEYVTVQPEKSSEK